MSTLAIKHGYYFVVDRNDDEKILHIEIGKGYQNDGVVTTSIKEEGGFLTHYFNGVRSSTRDTSLLGPLSFSKIADDFLKKITDEYTNNALVKRVDNNLVPYFD